MKQIELVTALPNWHWTKHCQEEINITGQELIDISDFIWRIGNVAVAGFVYNSYINPPWMWFVLAEKVTISDLIDFRRLTRKIPVGTMTCVASDFAIGLRFAKLYGFVETGEQREYFGKAHTLMRKK
jgi:hypothetical protein